MKKEKRKERVTNKNLASFRGLLYPSAGQVDIYYISINKGGK